MKGVGKMYQNYNYPYRVASNKNMIMNYNNPQDDRYIGGFLGPFLLGGLTGGVVAPFFWGGYNNRPNYYYPPYQYYGPYYR